METLTHTVRDFTVKETAQEMRKALKAQFPGVRFSVTMSRGTGHGWLRVSYTDGPLERDVRAVCDGFRSSRFDGMDDSYHTVAPTLYALPDGSLYEPRYSCCGANTSRHLSDAAMSWARATATRGSYWWPIGAEFETWQDPGYYAAMNLLHGLDLSHGLPHDPKEAFRESWQ